MQAGSNPPAAAGSTLDNSRAASDDMNARCPDDASQKPSVGRHVYVKFDDPDRWYHGIVTVCGPVLDKKKSTSQDDDKDSKGGGKSKPQPRWRLSVRFDDDEMHDAEYPADDVVLCPDPKRAGDAIAVGDVVVREGAASGDYGVVLRTRPGGSPNDEAADPPTALVHEPRHGSEADEWVVTSRLERLPTSRPPDSPTRPPAPAPMAVETSQHGASSARKRAGRAGQKRKRGSEIGSWEVRQLYRYLMSHGDSQRALDKLFAGPWSSSGIEKKRAKEVIDLLVSTSKSSVSNHLAAGGAASAAVTIKVMGVSFNATSLLKRLAQMSSLRAGLDKCKTVYEYRLPAMSDLRAPKWSLSEPKWTPVQDAMLLVGVHLFGIGAWDDAIRHKELGLIPHLCKSNEAAANATAKATFSPRPPVRTRGRRCGMCSGCTREACGTCKFCIDRKGPNVLKKACVLRVCHALQPAPVAPARSQLPQPDTMALVRVVSGPHLRARALALLKRLVQYDENKRQLADYTRRARGKLKLLPRPPGLGDAEGKDNSSVADGGAVSDPGSEAYRAGNAAVAIALWGALLKSHPSEYWAMHNIGLAMMKLSRYDEAITQLECAAGMAPKDDENGRAAIAAALARARPLRASQRVQKARDTMLKKAARRARGLAEDMRAKAKAASLANRPSPKRERVVGGSSAMAHSAPRIPNSMPQLPPQWRVVRKGGLFTQVAPDLRSASMGVLREGQVVYGVAVGSWVRHKEGYSLREQNGVPLMVPEVKVRPGRGSRRLSRCGRCTACTRTPCGKCKYCIDRMGPKILKQACALRRCKAPRTPAQREMATAFKATVATAPPATVSIASAGGFDCIPRAIAVAKTDVSLSSAPCAAPSVAVAPPVAAPVAPTAEAPPVACPLMSASSPHFEPPVAAPAFEPPRTSPAVASMAVPAEPSPVVSQPALGNPHTPQRVLSGRIQEELRKSMAIMNRHTDDSDVQGGRDPVRNVHMSKALALFAQARSLLSRGVGLDGSPAGGSASPTFSGKTFELV